MQIWCILLQVTPSIQCLSSRTRPGISARKHICINISHATSSQDTNHLMAMTTPAKMRAAIFRRHGPPSVLQVVEDFPTPTARRGEVLMKVEAISANSLDWKLRSGAIPGFIQPKPKVSHRLQRPSHAHAYITEERALVSQSEDR